MFRQLLMLAALVASSASAYAQEVDIPRTPEGHPDFQGVWESRWLTPFERMDGTTDATVSGEAAEVYAAARMKGLQSEGVALHPDDDFDFAGLLPADDDAFRTSLIVEPANGKRPQTQIARDVGAANRSHRDRAENPEALSNDERCLSANGRAPLGISPGSMYRQIVQTADHLLIYTEDQMVTRIIGIGAEPRPVGLVSLAGDSVANWEGDTLVVVTTQIRPQLAPPGGPTFDQQRRVTERFTLIAPDQISYDYVLEDSAMLSERLRVEYSFIRTDQVMYESACHEGNHSIQGMMLGARLLEQSTTAKPKP
jgi:hypothetical protein